MTLTVSKLADQVGVSPDTVRHYERLGLIPAPRRSASGYRLYEDHLVERLRFIKNAQHTELSAPRDVADADGCDAALNHRRV